MLWQHPDTAINVQVDDQNDLVRASKDDSKIAEANQGFSRNPPARQSSSPVAKILFLDGVRGAAVVFVVTQHSGYMHDIYMGAVEKHQAHSRASVLPQVGWTLVDYFSKRFFRVYPLFALVAITLWFLPFEYKKRYYLVKQPEDFNLFQTLTFHPEHRHYLMWTLPLEISYYFILPAFVLAVLKMRRFWWISFVPLYVWSSTKDYTTLEAISIASR
ncbi:hypothetical protein PF010_g27837 [Phytophthora fragariae]|uniref:Acyltransferase 3 domain-containing protein n=1 Tax=Phytophthora fragariae TaxID=53985 RepID=A0A6G0JTM8_9STRA|nr:hypothetical protein PF010_g27837 [Phytophthora fragariae]